MIGHSRQRAAVFARVTVSNTRLAVAWADYSSLQLHSTLTGDEVWCREGIRIAVAYTCRSTSDG
jgi:hypothetical protein